MDPFTLVGIGIGALIARMVFPDDVTADGHDGSNTSSGWDSGYPADESSRSSSSERQTTLSEYY